MRGFFGFQKREEPYGHSSAAPAFDLRSPALVPVYSGANGLFSSVAQIIFIRELFSVFSGNEFLLGLSFSIWLLSGALGSRLSRKFLPVKLQWLTLLYLVSCVAGIIIIRAVPRLLLPGELHSPILIAVVVIFAQAPCSFFTGVLFGILAARHDGKRVYRWDNAGNLAGLALISLAVYFHKGHLPVILFTAGCLLPVIWKSRAAWGLAIICLVVFAIVEPVSNRWKYRGKILSVIHGREGEIAIDHEKNMVFLNNRVYRTGFSVPLIEQSVHVPLSIADGRRNDGCRILLIHDNGHSAEIRKYEPADLLCIESEPALADSGCICQTPEKLSRNQTFDVVLLGSDVPENIAMSRLFTDAFFSRTKGIMADSGLFSFTLSLNSNYLDKHERKLKDLLVATLSQVFRVVKVFPGEGWTFVASDHQFGFAPVCRVPTNHYADYILAVVSPDKIASANQPVSSAGINKVTHPLALKYTLERYLDKFHIPVFPVILVSILVLLISCVIFLRAGPLFSIGTTGFCTGSYAVVIMMFYQSLFGTLYSRVSLLMIAMAVGFVAGSFFRKLPLPDLTVGLYSVFSLVFMAAFRQPPEMLFFFFNAIMGFLSGAQLVNYRKIPWEWRNAADLAGGVAGMGLVASVMLPYFGVTGIVIAMAVVKIASLGKVSEGLRKN